MSSRYQKTEKGKSRRTVPLSIFVHKMYKDMGMEMVYLNKGNIARQSESLGEGGANQKRPNNRAPW